MPWASILASAMDREWVEHAVEYPHPPERVWRALTRGGELAAWLMPNDFEPVVGRKFVFRASATYGWSGVIECEVLEVDEPFRLAYIWRSGQTLHLTLIEWTFRATPNGTLVTLRHSRSIVREERQLSRFFKIQVDETALTDELFAFVSDPSPSRRRRPVVSELDDLNNEIVEVLESMVLDGVDQRQFVADYVHALAGQMLA